MQTFDKILFILGVVTALLLDINGGTLRVYAQSEAGDWGAEPVRTARAPAPPFHSPFRTFSALPLYLQTAPPWRDDVYGSYPDGDAENTMARWGCFTTSAAMVVNYYGESLGFQTTPAAVNAWMRAHGGYSDDNGAQLPKVIEYARRNRVPLGLVERFWGEDDARLDAALTAGHLAILGVEDDGHYVVAHARINHGGETTYAIHDPLYGRTTLAEQWDGVYSSAAIIGVAPEWKQIVQLALPAGWAPSAP
jgi:hypothetical protein